MAAASAAGQTTIEQSAFRGKPARRRAKNAGKSGERG
jgi:hypothetical protein